MYTGPNPESNCVMTKFQINKTSSPPANKALDSHPAVHTSPLTDILARARILETPLQQLDSPWLESCLTLSASVGTQIHVRKSPPKSWFPTPLGVSAWWSRWRQPSLDHDCVFVFMIFDFLTPDF